MYYISFALLFLAITSVLYGTTGVWSTSDYEFPLNVLEDVEMTDVTKSVTKSVKDDLISSPPDVGH